MNIEILNTVNLDGTPVTYQSISNSGGGGNSGGEGSEMPIIGDGKTYLYIDINPKCYFGKEITLFYRGNITKSNVVTIDWGDGNKETKGCNSSGTSRIPHTYSKTGKYIISLDIEDGVVLKLEDPSYYYGIFGNASGYAYGGIILTAAELGKNIELSSSTFICCYSLTSVIIQNSVTSIVGFGNCYSLRNIVVGNGVNFIKPRAFTGCMCLYSIDFSSSLSVPTLENTNSIPSGKENGIYSNLSIIVPDALYDEWISATNWSSFVSIIIKKSDWDALQ